MLRPSFPEYREYRFLKLASSIALVALVIYWLAWPATGTPYGGTWYGYVLGIASGLLILLLAAYGIRKRRFPVTGERRRTTRRRQVFAETPEESSRRNRDRRTTPASQHWRHADNLQAWLSSHVYLGLLLLVLASLHSSFRFGWNVHILTYVLMWLVVVSGLYGVFAYLRYPRMITENLGSDTLEDLLPRIAALDELAGQRALALPDEINRLVDHARRHTRLGGNLLQRLNETRRPCPTRHAVMQLERMSKQLVSGDQPRLMRDLYAVLLQKQRLVAKVHQDFQLNARLQAWLLLHVPLSIGLLAALTAHVLAVLIYW